VRKYIILLGITAVLLFMLPVSMALAMTTASPPTAINGNELTSITADPSATIVHTNDTILDATNVGITVDNSVIHSANADLIPANIKMDTGQGSSVTSEEVASTADVKTINGKNVDGANLVTAQNENTANLDNLSVMDANSPAVTRNYTEGLNSVYGINPTNSTSDVYFYRIKADLAVLKLPTSAGANFVNRPAEYIVANFPVDISGLVAAQLKMPIAPINIVANNTRTLTHAVYILSMADTAINATTTSATIEYSMMQAGQKVRTLTSEELVATYSMDLGVTTSAAEQIAVPDLAMINSADAVYFTDITVTAMVQNQETVAYANDLVASGIESEAILVDEIADTASGRAPTTTYSGTFAFDIAGAGLVTMSFV